MTPEEIAHQKDIEFYASSVNAWFNTSLEHDKSILTLAAGGIGLLITLLTTVGISSSEALVLYVGAITSFLVALVSVLVVFRSNRTYIERVLAGKAEVNDPVLAKADSIALWAFGAGVVFTALIGIASAIHSFTSKEKSMATEPTKQTQATPSDSRLTVCIESFNGVANLQKSFNGAANLLHLPTASTTAPTATATASTTTSPLPSTSQNQNTSGK